MSDGSTNRAVKIEEAITKVVEKWAKGDMGNQAAETTLKDLKEQLTEAQQQKNSGQQQG